MNAPIGPSDTNAPPCGGAHRSAATAAPAGSLAARSCCAQAAPLQPDAGHDHHADDASGKVLDPVCGMHVDPHAAGHAADYQGQTWGFCSAHCKEKFLADPQRWLDPAPVASQPVAEGAIYTCPMHPEIEQVGPGSCPKCGMALEPLLPSADADDGELRAVRRRVVIAALLAVPLLLVAMIPHLFLPHMDVRSAHALRWAELLLSAPLVLWAGMAYYVRGWNGLRAGRRTCTR